MGPEYKELKALVRREGLHTVCEEAGCPNIFECWEDREATFLIGGEQCTRRCDFCQIDTGKPAELDRDEPRRVAESVQAMGLRYSTVTGVARDDLPDGGAWLYAETVRAIKKLNPNTGVELLIPDFNGEPRAARAGLEARPEVLAHNVETVPRIFKRIRPAFRYDRSLAVLTAARDYGLVTKSNLILGMGETPDEVRTALRDLYDAGCDIVTITQYLRPSLRHHPVERWVKPEEFVEHEQFADGARLRRGAGRSRWFGRRTGRAGCTRRRAARSAGRRTTPYPEQMAKPRDPAAAKAAKAEAKAARKAASKQRRSQLWQAFQIQRKEDKRLLPYMIGAFVLIVARPPWLRDLRRRLHRVHDDPAGRGARRAGGLHHLRPPRAEVGVPQGRRADRCRGVGAGQPARQVAGHPRRRRHRSLRRGAPVIGRPGVIFVGEGSATRVKPLLAQEKKRTARLVGDIPIYDVMVGNGEGEVPLAKLERHLTKLPANITVKQMDSLESRLAALGTKAGPAAMPKGPLPARRPRCAAYSARCAGAWSSAARTAVFVTLSCSPRRSASVISAGMTTAISTPAHQGPAESDVLTAVDRAPPSARARTGRA